MSDGDLQGRSKGRADGAAARSAKVERAQICGIIIYRFKNTRI
jgi:hypothetical protein